MIRINDVLGYKDLKIFQDSDFFSFSLDSVILANLTNIRLSDKLIIDFCTGNAIVPLILSKRCSKNIEGIEIQEKVYSLAQKSVSLNDLDDRINIYNCDVKDFCSDEKNQNKYDLVLCNPPYFKIENDSKKNLKYEQMVARHEILINLDDICNCAKKILKDNGSFSLVHRTDRLMEIITCLKNNNIEPKIIRFIYESPEKKSNLVIIQGQKNGKVGLIVEPPFYLYNSDGSYSDEYFKLQNEVRR